MNIDVQHCRDFVTIGYEELENGNEEIAHEFFVDAYKCAVSAVS